MNKVALCFSGLARGKNDIGRDSGGIDYSFPHFKRHILEKNDVDIFVHSWSVDSRDDILNLFKPKKYIIEPQIKFSNKESMRPHPNKLVKYWRGHKVRSEHESSMGDRIAAGKKPSRVIGNYRPRKNLKQQCYSQWYSRQKSIELKKEYEEEKDFVYDYVMMVRFDVVFFVDVIFENFNNKYFYAPRNTDPLIRGKPAKYNASLIYKNNPEKIKFVENDYREVGMMDFWFFSNSEYMDKFSKIYDNLDDLNQNCTASDRDGLGYMGSERVVVLHLNNIGIEKENIRQVFHRTRDYELVRRWYFNSLY